MLGSSRGTVTLSLLCLVVGLVGLCWSIGTVVGMVNNLFLLGPSLSLALLQLINAGFALFQFINFSLLFSNISTPCSITLYGPVYGR